MKTIFKKVILSLLIFICLSVTFSLTKPINAQTYKEVNIVTTPDLRVTPGVEFYTEVSLENGYYVSGFQFSFLYDSDKFTLSRVESSDINSGNFQFYTGEINKIKVSYSNVYDAFNGHKSLFKIYFIPNSTIEMTSHQLLSLDSNFDQMVTWVDYNNDLIPVDNINYSFQPVSKGVFGDVNSDGQVNIIDVGLIQQYLIRLRDFDLEQSVLADVNDDGNIDMIDVAHIQQFLVGLRTDFIALEHHSGISSLSPKLKGLFLNQTYYLGSGSFDILDGVKAYDYHDMDITERIDVMGDYNLSEVGIYDVLVSVSDEEGNYLERNVSVFVKDLDSYEIPETLTSDSIEIDLWHSNGATVENALMGYAEEFEALYPNVTINIIKSGNNYDELRQNVVNAVRSESLPDIVQNYSEHVMEYIDYGALIPLTPYIYNSTWGYNPDVEDESFLDILLSYRRENSQYTSDGEYYSLPFNKSTEVMIYNKTIMDALIDEGTIDAVPETWQGLFAIADDMRRVAVEEGIIDATIDILNTSSLESVHKSEEERQAVKDNFVPIAYDSPANAFITLTRQWGGEYTGLSGDGEGLILFDNPQTRAALSYFYDLRDEDGNPGAFTIPGRWGTEYASDAFKASQTAVTFGSTGGARYNTPVMVDGAYSFEFGVAPMPYNADLPEYRTAIQQGTNMAITNAGDDQEKLASWLFLKFLTSKEVQLDFALETGYSPVRSSVYDEPAFIQFASGLDSEGNQLAGEALMKAYAAQAASQQADFLFYDQAFVGASVVRNAIDQSFSQVILNHDVTKELNIDSAIESAIDAYGGYRPPEKIYSDEIEYLFRQAIAFPYKEEWTESDRLDLKTSVSDENAIAYNVTWESSHPNVIGLDGTISAIDEKTNVILTASINVNGTIYDKKIYFTVAKMAEGQEVATIAEAIALGQDAYVEILGVTVVAMYGSGDVFFTDGTDILYIYSPPFTVEIGDVLDITGLIDFYYNAPQMAGSDTNPLRIAESDAAASVAPVIAGQTVNDVIGATSQPSTENPHQYLTYEVTGAVYYEESWGNYSVFLVPSDYDFDADLADGATQPNGNAIMIYFRSDMDVLKAFHGQVVTIDIVMQGYRTDKTVFYANFFGETSDLLSPVDQAVDYLDINLEDLLVGIQLPQFSDDWSTQFFWTSDTPDVIANDGFVKNPPLGAEDATVTLTVRAQEYGGTYTATRDFTFVVEANPEVVISEVKNVEFIGTSEEYVVTDLLKFPLYYTDGGELPYVDIESFFNLVEGAVEPDLVTFTMTSSDVMEISYSFESYEEGVPVNYSATLNFTENTLTVNNFDFFANYAASTVSGYGEGLNYVDADYFEGQEVTFPLGLYDIDLTIYNDEGIDVYLMPLAIANIIFMSDIYYQVYYNGDTLYGVDTLDLSDGDIDIINEIHVSSYNDLDMPEDVHLATYNALALVMDYFYGLKDERNYDTYYEKISASMKTLISGTDNEVYNKIFDLMYGMDDLHTSHIFYGYYDTRTTSGLSFGDLGQKSVAFYEGLWAVQDLLTEKFGGFTDDDLPAYSLIDDDTVAVIHITGFSIDTPDEFKATLDNLPASVTDVVIDLSYNTGGNIGAVMRIFGYMTEDQYFYHSQNPADGSAVTYHLESDYVAYDYNWYVLTSSVTFSAANMFASMAKELGIPVIGQMSSGGASSIGSFVLPDGSAVMISTNNVLSTRIGNDVDGYEYVSVENGVPVDYFLSNVASDSQLINAIEQAKSEND